MGNLKLDELKSSPDGTSLILSNPTAHIFSEISSPVSAVLAPLICRDWVTVKKGKQIVKLNVWK